MCEPRFYLVQNNKRNKIYHNFKGPVIVLDDDSHSFSSCDKHGNAGWLPYDGLMFHFADDEVMNSWEGQIEERYGEKFAVTTSEHIW